MPKIVFFLQILAIIVYPLASADRATASSSIEQASDINANHSHLTKSSMDDRRSAQTFAMVDADDAIGLQYLSSGDFEASDCCCAGPVGLCLTLVSGAPGMPLVSGGSRVESQHELVFIGTILALIPHPPKTLA